MEAEVESPRMRSGLVLEWVLTALWCLFILWRNDLGPGYLIAFCVLGVAIPVYAVKARAWTFLTGISGVAFISTLLGLKGVFD